MRVAVVDDPRDAAAEDAVTLGLEFKRTLRPAGVLGVRGEGLGGHGGVAAAHVRDGSGRLRVTDHLASPRTVALCLEVCRFHALVREAPLVEAPELAHRDIRLQTVPEVIERAIAIRLAMEEEPQLMATRGHASGVVPAEKLAYDGAEIAQEAFGRIGGINHESGKHRQPRRDGVAARSGELIRKALRPVLATHLVAVDQHALEGAVAANAGRDLSDVGVKGPVKCGGGKLVALESVA